MNDFWERQGLNLDVPDSVSIDNLDESNISGQGNKTENTTQFTQPIGETPAVGPEGT